MPNNMKREQKKVKDSKIYDIPNYAQSEEFTSAAACAMMLLKYAKKGYKMTRRMSSPYGKKQCAEAYGTAQGTA